MPSLSYFGNWIDRMSLSTHVVFGASSAVSSFRRATMVLFSLWTLPWSSSSSPASSPSSSKHFHRIQPGGSIPPHTRHPSYHPPAGFGGMPRRAGHDGLVVLSVSWLPGDDPSPELLAPEIPVFRPEGPPAEQTYRIPGNPRVSPRHRLVTVRAWGAGGGGCFDGRDEPDGDIDDGDGEEDEEDMDESLLGAGRGGSYVEATFRLSAGDVLTVVVGGGGGAGGNNHDGDLIGPRTSLGGKGGHPRGEDGRSDRFGGGGGGGGASTVSLSDGTLLLAAFGGDGGGSTEDCPARGGRGGGIGGDGIGADSNAGGYVDVGRAYVPPEREAMGPGVPATTELYHDRASFSWNAGAEVHWTSRDTYIHEYVVSVARTGTHSDDKHKCPDQGDASYRVHDTLPRNTIDATRNATATVSGLDANTSYCFLVRAFSKEGIDLGNRILPFRTKPEPVNEWISVPIRLDEPHLPFEAKHGDDWSRCEHSTARPTGRRGHSMTAIDNQVYVFGGTTLQCLCETIDSSPARGTKETRCSSRTVHSDELFHFDPVTATFTLLETVRDSERPEGREQHSATALANGNILVVGGVTGIGSHDAPSIHEDPSRQRLLSDIWRLSHPHRVTTRVATTRTATHPPLELIPGQITRHVLSFDGEGSNGGEEEWMCVQDVRVTLSITHSCPSAVEYIALAGPGSGTWSGSVDGLDFLPPPSYDYDVQLYVSSADNLQNPCQPETLRWTFSDHEPESILSRSRIPARGAFRPASGLSPRFRDIPFDDDHGPWELSIAQRSPTSNETITGTLLDWQLILDITPCEAKAKWERLPSPPPSFAPRRLHSSIAVGDSLFVSGGFGRIDGSGAERRLDDLWRWDYDSGAFVELRASFGFGEMAKTRMYYGRVALLGPLGLLGYGGVASRGPSPPGKDLWLRDIFEKDWVSVPVKDGSDAAASSVNDKIPYGRYLSSITLLDSEILRRIHNIDGPWPMAMTFGGDGAFLHNGYNDDDYDYGLMTNSLFNDVWILSAGAIATNSSVQNQRRRDHCHWRQLPTSTSVRIWNETCGWKDSGSESAMGVCRWDEILIRAWCLEQYQSFYLS